MSSDAPAPSPGAEVLELHCRDGSIVRVLFAIDGCDREIIAWSATTEGVSGEMVRDLIVACVEPRFGQREHAGSAYTAEETARIAAALGLRLAFTPVRSPESNGISEAFGKTPQAGLCKGHDAARCRDRDAASPGLV